MAETPKTILILVGPEYEDLEVWYPKLRLEEAGFETKLAGMGEATYRGKHGYPATMDGHVRDFPASHLAGIIAPSLIARMPSLCMPRPVDSHLSRDRTWPNAHVDGRHSR